MMLIEVFVPAGVFGPPDRQALGRRLVDAIVGGEGPPESVLANARSLCQALVHEVDTWVTGDPAVDAATPPRYVVRTSVPASWRKDMSPELIKRITAALADGDDDPGRFREHPHAWVHIVGVPENGSGVFGRPMSGVDLTKFITAEHRSSPERAAATAGSPGSGTVIDPVCGMTVELTGSAVTLTHDGTTYGFCAAICRQVFVEELKLGDPQ